MKVLINAGHAPDGNPDPGAVGMNGLRESDVACSVGHKVVSYLRAAGVNADFIQSDDLSEITKTANACGYDVFVSIHCNSAGSEDANGTEVWACAGSSEGSKIAQYIDSQIVNALGTMDRGVKIATPHVNGLYVLTNTDAIACLVELAFISNKYEEELLSHNQDDFARAVARGITDYERER